MANFKGKERPGLLGPQSVMSLSGIGITEKSMQAVEKGFLIFLSGIIYYNDIFQRSQLHVTKFCYQMTAFHSDKNEIVSGYDFCKHWNCADDECGDDKKAWNDEVTAGKIQKPFELPKGATPFSIPIPIVPPPTKP